MSSNRNVKRKLVIKYRRINMLKIKDEVDLKELGFEKDDGDILWQDDYGLIVDSRTKIISLPYFDHKDKTLNELYDLIQAGLVEKVEEV
jgi:hypothetical protein